SESRCSSCPCRAMPPPGWCVRWLMGWYVPMA
ncbi:uncharacterized protein METZ01_LOCUS374606, partial [marine metagenome]